MKLVRNFKNLFFAEVLENQNEVSYKEFYSGVLHENI